MKYTLYYSSVREKNKLKGSTSCMSLDNSTNNDELVRRLLDRLDNSVSTGTELEQIKHSLDKLEATSEAQDKIIDGHNLDIIGLKRDIETANRRLDDIQEEFDTEVKRVNNNIDNLSGNRNKSIEYIFTLILGALVPSVINLMLH